MSVHRDADQAVERAEALITERRRHEQRLNDLSRLVDATLDAIDQIDEDLAGGVPVVQWRRR